MGKISELTKVSSPDTFDRLVYADRAIATMQSTDNIKISTVRTTGFDAVASAGQSPETNVSIASMAASGKATYIASEIFKNDRTEITAAKIFVSGGLALGAGKTFMDVITPPVDKLGAAITASCAAVDAGYAPNDWQVGQTGKIVATQLYITVDISGVIQRLSCMRGSWRLTRTQRHRSSRSSTMGWRLTCLWPWLCCSCANPGV
jgi:electron transfer flavoprotein alpha subunit